jgi:hypothetical protein
MKKIPKYSLKLTFLLFLSKDLSKEEIHFVTVIVLIEHPEI